MIIARISRLSKSQNRNRILLGLTTLGLSLGIIGTLSSKSAIQTLSRTALTQAFNTSLLSTKSQGLRTTVDPTTLFLGAVGAGAGVAGAIIAGLDYSHSKASSQQQSQQLDEMNKRLDSMDGKLTSLQKDSGEIKATLSDIKKTQRETKKVLEDSKKIQEETKEILRGIANALGRNKSPETKTKKKTGGSSRTRKRT